MKENEFDKYVKDLMLDAEEAVSPSVWQGVSSALDRAAPKRVVPLWVWRTSAVVATAAAAIAAVLLVQRPKTAPLPEAPVAVVEMPATAPEQPAEEAIREASVPESIAVQAERIRAREAFLPAEHRQALPQQVQETAVPQQVRELVAPAAVPVNPSPERVSTDQEAFNRLLFEDHSYRPGRRMSFSGNGNLQGNHRGDIRTNTSTMRRVAQMDPIIPTIREDEPEFNFAPPFSLGASFRYDFNDRFGIGSGFFYTYLSRSFMGTYWRFDDDYNALPPVSGSVDEQQHWIGIPLTGYLNLVTTGTFKAYLYAGGAIEKLLADQYLIYDRDSGKDYHYSKTLPYGFQSSARLGLGLEYRLTPQWGLYLDPSVRYYFNNRQPRSIRTIQPLRFDIEVGVRFTL